MFNICQHWTASQQIKHEMNRERLMTTLDNHPIRFFHQSHNTVLFGGLFTLKQWIISSLKHDTVPRVNKLYCFYVKKPPKRIALWDRENSQCCVSLIRCNSKFGKVTHSDQWRGPFVIGINHVLESFVKLTFANY